MAHIFPLFEFGEIAAWLLFVADMVDISATCDGGSQSRLGSLCDRWFFATPLKNDGLRQLGWLKHIKTPTEWEKKMFQTTNQI